jgi:hypothetical protein
MHNEPSPSAPLGPEQQGRFDMAAAAAAAARNVDLTAMPHHQLVLAFERIRSSLEDTLRLIQDISEGR